MLKVRVGQNLLHSVAARLALSLRWEGCRLFRREKRQGAAVVHCPKHSHFRKLFLCKVQFRWAPFWIGGCLPSWAARWLDRSGLAEGVRGAHWGEERRAWVLQTLDWARRGPLGSPLGRHTRGALRRPQGLIVASHKRGGNHSGGQHKLLEHHGTEVFVYKQVKEIGRSLPTWLLGMLSSC